MILEYLSLENIYFVVCAVVCACPFYLSEIIANNETKQVWMQMSTKNCFFSSMQLCLYNIEFIVMQVCKVHPALLARHISTTTNFIEIVALREMSRGPEKGKDDDVWERW